MHASPVRVLEVVGKMDPAGTETWLAAVAKRIDRKDIAIDFLVHEAQPGAYDCELLERGCRIYRITNPQNPLEFGIRFLKALKQAPRYDLIHSHVDHYSGFIALLGRLAGIRTRIVHSHNTGYIDKRGPARSIYTVAMGCSIQLNATSCLAASQDAAAWMFGSRWRQDSRCRVLPCGVDLTTFRSCGDVAALRDEFRIPGDALVVGHVGRFHPQKNHSFLVEVAECLLKDVPRAMFVLAGDGPRRFAIQSEVHKRGLDSHFRFLGVRRDIARLMSAMDIFLFPSICEGLGLVLIEAQAAGLPCLISDSVPLEAAVVPGLVERLSLTTPPEQWAAALQRIRPRRADERRAALKIVERSQFNITQSIDSLLKLYTSAN